jgi:hypothetical protein
MVSLRGVSLTWCWKTNQQFNLTCRELWNGVLKEDSEKLSWPVEWADLLSKPTALDLKRARVRDSKKAKTDVEPARYG